MKLTNTLQRGMNGLLVGAALFGAVKMTTNDAIAQELNMKIPQKAKGEHAGVQHIYSFLSNPADKMALDSLIAKKAVKAGEDFVDILAAIDELDKDQTIHSDDKFTIATLLLGGGKWGKTGMEDISHNAELKGKFFAYKKRIDQIGAARIQAENAKDKKEIEEIKQATALFGNVDK